VVAQCGPLVFGAEQASLLQDLHDMVDEVFDSLGVQRHQYVESVGCARFTALLDTLSIIAFILIAAVVTVHLIWEVPWRWAWLVAPGYLAFALGLNAALAAIGGERAVLGGYLPALVGLVVFGLAIRLTAPAESRRFGTLLLWTATLFAVSLTLRTLGGPLCADLPVGTHFLWHCLNATVMFLARYTVIRCWQAQSNCKSVA
jgi:hypothetical protein